MKSGASSLIRTPWVSGLLAGLWVSLFLVFDGHAEHIVAWSAVPLCTAGVALLARLPAVGTCCVIAAAGVCAFTGIPYGEI